MQTCTASCDHQCCRLIRDWPGLVKVWRSAQLGCHVMLRAVNRDSRPCVCGLHSSVRFGAYKFTDVRCAQHSSITANL